MVEVDDGGDRLEVRVVVDQDESVLACKDGGQEVRHADRAMAAGAGHSLDGERALPMFVVGREVLVGDTSTGLDLFVLVGVLALNRASASSVAQVAARPCSISGSSSRATAGCLIRAYIDGVGEYIFARFVA
ncbi:hypothetical protein [Nocardia sp. NPDC051981]|uniref:hypothetical protein n=1 Tax=Nocardia sp. NPDC051981 TaxID=3155417 RepID=UPI003422B948